MLQKWKHDPGVRIKHDDLYARASERDYERPTSDTKNNNVTPANSTKTAVQHDLSNRRNVERTKNLKRAFPKNSSL